jgi:hypothetical protein
MTADATYGPSSATPKYTFSYTVGSGDGNGTVTLSVGTDLAGNVVAGTPSNNTFIVDNTSTVNQDTIMSSNLRHQSDAAVTITPSSSSGGSSSDTVWFAPSGTTSFDSSRNDMTSASGSSVSISAPATVGVYYLYVIDEAGNVSTHSTYSLTVDNTRPTAAITYSPIGPYQAGESVTITATFNKDMNTSVIPQFNLSGIQSVGPSAMSFSGASTTVCTYTYTVPSGDGTGTITLTVGQDIAGNIITNTPTGGTGTFTVDNTSSTNQDLVFTASIRHKGGDTVSVTSSSSTSGGAASDSIWFAPSGTTGFSNFVANVTTITTAGGSDTSIVAPTTAGDYKLFIIDAADNVSSVNNSTYTLTIDNTAPTVALVYSSVSPYKGGENVTITATFSEPMATSPVPTYAVSGAAGSNITNMSSSAVMTITDSNTWASASNPEYTATYNVSATGTGTATISINDCTDLAGNLITTTPTGNTGTFSIDNTPPGIGSVTVTSNNSVTPANRAKSGDTITIGFTADEPIQNVSVTLTSDGTAGNGSFGTPNHAGSNVWSITYDVHANDTTGVVVLTISYDDLVDNSSTHTYTPSMHIDNTPPVITLNGSSNITNRLYTTYWERGAMRWISQMVRA